GSRPRFFPPLGHRGSGAGPVLVPLSEPKGASMKNCDSVQATLIAWSDGEYQHLGQPVATLVRHLLTCSACRRALASSRALRGALQALPTPAPQATTRAAVLAAVCAMAAPLHAS